MAIDFARLRPDCPIVPTAHYAPHWEICWGLALAHEVCAQHFSSYARIAPFFRSPTPAERKRFAASAPDRRHGFVTVVPIAPQPVRVMSQYVHDFRRGRGIETTARRAVRELLSGLRRVLDVEGEVQIRRPGPERARQLGNTLSGHLPGAPRAGLHIDAARHTLLSQHHPDGFFTEPNRTLINLGPAERWFIWIPFSFQSIAEQLGFEKNRRVGGTELLAQVAAAVPVLRVKVPTATAYVAPYEAVFHDGSTETATEGGYGLPLIGSFGLPVTAKS